MMSQNTAPAAHSQRPIEDVLDFCVELSRRMISCGANIERVSLAVERICKTYRLTDTSLFLLSTNVILSARDSSGFYASRQLTIPPAVIDLTKLNSLNRLCYTVVSAKPSPQKLKALLDKASDTKDYSDRIVLLAQVAALSCLCLIFGGWIREIICVAVITVMMHYLLILLAIPGIDRILTSAFIMWFATTAVFFLSWLGIPDREPIVIQTLVMLVLPGIPLVNAMRNLLCGNEMNGILQTAKVTVETMSLALGIFLSFHMFGSPEQLDKPFVSVITSPLLLILLSFAASACFGAVFQIGKKDLWLAGLGGALTRIVLLVFTPILPRLIYMTVSAFAASLYAEFLATLQKKPSTYYVYPAIIPLIPGDLFFFTLLGIYIENKEMVMENGYNCVFSLASMSFGFVLSFVAAHYIRKFKMKMKW